MAADRSSVPRRAAPWGILVVVLLGALVAAKLVWSAQQPNETSIAGRVVTAAGKPVAGATVRTRDGRRARTDSSGWFTLEGEPAWATVSASGWVSRTKVLGRGREHLVRLVADRPGTVTLTFGGDVMFGRRYFDAREDGSMRGLLEPDDGPAAHRRLLTGVEPMLADADLTVVNLESPLAEDPAYDVTGPRPPSFHPTKDYVFASAPAAAAALVAAGVDVVDIGNNHLFDRLEEGVVSTRRVLADVGLAPGSGFFGAGADADEAWEPAYQVVKGQRVAVLGCTSIPGDDQPIAYVANRTKAGAARCRPERLRRAVLEARNRADIVVAMVHGGYEYGRRPSIQVRQLTDTAVTAGATMVINHHPHVVGGLRFAEGRLTAWTLGNLLFDQTVWPSFESYLLKVVVRDSRVVGAWAEPFRIQRYQPTGVYGEDASWVARGALARSRGPWVAEDGSLWLDAREAWPQRREATTPAGLVELESGCVSDAARELLWTGDFEGLDLQPDVPAPLWNVGAENPYRRLSEDAARSGRTGVLLHRADRHESDVLLNPLHRVLVEPRDRLTLLLDHRAQFGEPKATVQLSWYNDTRGGSQEQTVVELPVGEEWATARLDVTVPANAVAVMPYIRVSPPEDNVAQLAVDNVRLVNWDEPGCDYVEGPRQVVATGLPPERPAVQLEPVTATTLPLRAPAPLPPGPPDALSE